MDDTFSIIDAAAETLPDPPEADRPIFGRAAAQVIDLALPLHERSRGALALLVLDPQRRLIDVVTIAEVAEHAHTDPVPAGLASLARSIRSSGLLVVFARGRPGQPFLNSADEAWLLYAQRLFGDRLADSFLATPDLVRPLNPGFGSGAA